jgi:hypothetical protein
MKFGIKSDSPSEVEVTTAVRSAVAENAEADAFVESVPEVETIEPIEDAEGNLSGAVKLSQLIDNSFPFDESQLDAIEGICDEQYACLTGAAGTGKTTTTKAIVQRLQEGSALRGVNMEKYWKKGFKSQDADDDYEAPQKWVPAVAMCAFTGRATQMIKKNFPRDWHGNIMTIHRMLGFYPEYYEEYDDEKDEVRKKVRFVPTYNADFKLPWDIIIIDEAGMLGIDLWLQLIAACKDGCRIIMIGDINQLPPVHGKSIFGYAMCAWPAWELTHVHRQQGVNNEIVDNAWRVIHGQRPQSGGRFLMIPLKGDAQFSSRQMRKMIPELVKRNAFDPIRDSIITPINGEEGARGFALGQLPLNREYALIFNPKSEHPRFIIDGGRERKQFAVGDKVMATKNDWDAGITNGMTGVITEIAANAEYSGDRRLFGPVEEVNAYLNESEEAHDYVEFDLADLDESMVAIDEGMQKAKEKRERGPSSHIVTVRFGDDEHGFEIPFGTLAEVGSLMTAYVVTCHKMQGGEAPMIAIILHDAHKAMLYREWLYTAITRASQRCYLFYKEDALRSALNKQKMPGRTLREKVLSFQKAQDIEIDGVNMARDVCLPESTSTRNRILDRPDAGGITPARLTTDAEQSGGLAMLLKAKKTEPKHEPEVKRVVVEVVHRTVRERVERVNISPSPDTQDASAQPVVDGGDVTPQRESEQERKPVVEGTGEALALPSPEPQLPAPIHQAVPLPGAAYMVMRLRETFNGPRLLTYTPTTPVEAPKTPRRFGVKA